jgi:hypothetical protein
VIGSDRTQNKTKIQTNSHVSSLVAGQTSADSGFSRQQEQQQQIQEATPNA